jgi:membrane-associated protease RseP (regulator of RpoE activity)
MDAKSLLVWLSAVVVVVPFAGCAAAGSKTKPAAKPPVTYQRGWIGGQYELATRRWFAPPHAIHTFPPALTNSYKDAFLVTALGSNSPIRTAGLEEGDLILEVNHQPVTKPRDFRKTIDGAKPGAGLPVTVWRNGETNEYEVPVGRETYKKQGNFSIILNLPFPIHTALDLPPNPSFSLVALGFRKDEDHRDDVNSVKATYVDKYGTAKYQPYERDWRAWLVMFRLERGKVILTQENVAPGSTNTPVDRSTGH